MNISKALLTIRKYHAVKQKDLAAAIGVSNSYLCEIEKGQKSPNLEFLQKYSEYFDIPMSSLLFLSEHIDGKKGVSENFRVKAAGLILRMLEWSTDKDDKNDPKTKLDDKRCC